MRLDDVCSIEDGNSPTASTYWVGSRQSMSRGRLRGYLRPVIVLAKGSYTEYTGECGMAVQASSVAPKRLVVAAWRNSYGHYYTDQWEPRVISPAAILLTDAEYQERLRLQDADAKRHAEAQKKVSDRRKAVGSVVTGELLNGLAKHSHINFYRDGRKGEVKDFSITITLKPAQIKRMLSAEGKAALAELVTIKDPTC